ncbi:MAG: hemerythrin domain-containing protein [Ferruginibacter sp.]
MKRHEAIAPLSRDHHTTLILAQLLKKDAPVYKGLPDGPVQKARYAIEQFESHIQKHFQQEEMMLDIAAPGHPLIQRLAATIRAEHRELEALFQSLAGTTDATGLMNELAFKLEAHIRKEERELFPLLQQHCSEAELATINELLH